MPPKNKGEPLQQQKLDKIVLDIFTANYVKKQFISTRKELVIDGTVERKNNMDLVSFI